MFARIVPAQAGPDGVDKLVGYVESQMPEAESQPGFGGFYLLADRETGELMTISLWETQADVDRVEAEAAARHAGAAEETDVTPTPVRTYAVEIAHLPASPGAD
jgi:heme-degrading monooxygenase HmoA